MFDINYFGIITSRLGVIGVSDVIDTMSGVINLICIGWLRLNTLAIRIVTRCYNSLGLWKYRMCRFQNYDYYNWFLNPNIDLYERPLGNTSVGAVIHGEPYWFNKRSSKDPRFLCCFLSLTVHALRGCMQCFPLLLSISSFCISYSHVLIKRSRVCCLALARVRTSIVSLLFINEVGQ